MTHDTEVKVKKLQEIIEEEETADEEEAEVILELMDGQTVQVIYNGMLSRSIPAQLTALEIIIQP